jgi:hypothetical protein
MNLTQRRSPGELRQKGVSLQGVRLQFGPEVTYTDALIRYTNVMNAYFNRCVT